MAWNEQKPRESDLLKELASVIRSQKSELRAGIEKHFFWDESSGASAGELRYSADSAGPPGSARAFFGPVSEVSSADAGKLHVTSDTSRLYGYLPGGPVAIGSRSAIVADGASVATLPTNQKIMVLSGSTAGVASNSTTTIAFNPLNGLLGYSTAPVVQLTSTATMSGNTAVTSIPELRSSSATNFVCYINTFGVSSTHTVMWRSLGTRLISEDIA